MNDTRPIPCRHCKERPTLKVGSRRMLLECEAKTCTSKDSFILERESPALSNIPADARKLIEVWNERQKFSKKRREEDDE